MARKHAPIDVDRLLKGARLADIPIEEFKLQITGPLTKRLCP